MKLKTNKLAPLLIAMGVMGLVCLVQALRPAFFERLEWMTYDWRVREAVNFSPTAATNLGFVYINDKSIEAVHSGELGFHFGLYWPRLVYGQLVRELAAQGAKAVAFDVIFGELRADHPDVPVADKSLLAIDRLFGQPLNRFEDKTLLPSDVFFAWQMQKAGNVIIADTKNVAPHELFRTNAMAIGDIDADKDTDGVLRRARAFKLRWHPVFQAAASQLGIDLGKSRIENKRILLRAPDGQDTSIPLDGDGNFDLADFVGDKIPKGWPRHDKPFQHIWHMGIVVAAQELKLDLSRAEVDWGHGRIVLRGADGVQRVIPVDRNGYFYIDWSLRRTDARLTDQNIKDVLKQDHDRLADKAADLKNLWQNKLVIVGSTATGNDLADLGATPLDKETNLMSKHWNIANSVIMGRFIQRSSLPMELLLIIVAGAIVAILTWRLRSFTAFLAVMALATGYVALAFYLYVQQRYWLPLVLPVGCAMLMQYLCLVTYRAIFEQDEKRRLKSIFARLVSPDVFDELVKTEKLSLVGARREITVFFTDVRGFTELTDTNREKAAQYIREHKLTGEAAEACFDQQAQETLNAVNLYLGTIADMVIKHNGTLDKYIGDCVMAFWGAPIPSRTHAVACVRAAIDAQRAVQELNQQRSVQNQRRSEENVSRAAAGQPLLPLLPILEVGSGINTGVATAGLMGLDVHLNYTVFGREVNLASRLENISGRAHIIIGEATYAAISKDDPKLAASCVALPPVNVKGIRNAVNIYEVPWQPINPMPVASDKNTPAQSADLPEVNPAATTRA